MSFTDKYAERMATMKSNIMGSSIHEELEMKSISNNKLKAIMTDLEAIIGKPVYEDYNFRSGKIIGILRSIAQAPKVRQECLTATGLTQSHIDLYYEVIGNLPYESEGIVYLGRPMICDKAKELIMHTAMILNVLIEDSDLMDINEERWNAMVKRAMETASEAAKLKQSISIVNYDE